MKKIFLTLIVLVSVLSLVGCGKTDTRKSITLSDDGFGTTVLKYAADKDYVITEETGGKYKEMKIKSVIENFDIQLYHTDINATLFNETKENRKENSEGFQEFVWNGYEAYIYSADKFGLKFIVKFTETKGLFGEVSAVDYQKANVLEEFKNISTQDLFKTITFEEK